MASDEKKPAEPAAQPSTLPPPPPGPPPVYAEPPKHSNETPLPDYDIPQYNPANPQFAPPPNDNDDIYDATPTEEHPPSKFSRFFGRHHHSHGHEGEEEHGKKGKAKLTALGEAFASKVAGPVNAFANKFGAEGFLPESLDKECEKAARILRSFCSTFAHLRT
jgi:U5 snRNP spliceosome subunit